MSKLRSLVGPMAAGLAAGVIGTSGAHVLTGKNYEKLGILPSCDTVRTPEQALQPIADDKLTATIGHTAVCKLDDRAFEIVAVAKP